MIQQPVDRIERQAYELGYKIQNQHLAHASRQLGRLAIALCASVALNVALIVWSLS